jgi:gas vesicle protein
MNSTQKGLAGVLIGITAGVVAGLLLAPNSGTETRRKIAKQAGDLKDDVESQLNTVLNKLSGYVDQASATAKDYADKMSSGAKDAVNEYESKAKRAADQISNTAKSNL